MKVADIVQFAATQYQYSPKQGPRLIGLENEFPVVFPNGEGITWEVVTHLWDALEKHGWEMHRDGITNEITYATKDRPDLEGVANRTHDIIETEAGFHTLEIPLAPARSIQEAEKNLHKLLLLVSEIFDKDNAKVLGYGIHPVTKPRSANLAPKGRYRFMEQDSANHFIPKEDGVDLDAFTVSASSQTHVQVSIDEAIPATNALNALTGLRVALLANSPIWKSAVGEYKAVRELFWGWGQPDRLSQIGIPPRFQNLQHYVEYIIDFRSQMIRRDDTCYKLDNKKPFRNFILHEEGQMCLGDNGKNTHITSRVEDFNFECGVAWFDTRLQPAYGTIEERCPCQQPTKAQFAPSALNLGLVENLEEAIVLSEALSLDQWRDLRLSACTHGMQASLPGVDVYGMIGKMIDIAYEGLRKRGLGEEIYLAPLYTRLETKRCPADDAIEWFLNGGIGKMIEECDIRNALLSLA